MYFSTSINAIPLVYVNSSFGCFCLVDFGTECFGGTWRPYIKTDRLVLSEVYSQPPHPSPASNFSGHIVLDLSVWLVLQNKVFILGTHTSFPDVKNFR